jgi:hypothetical protein
LRCLSLGSRQLAEQRLATAFSLAACFRKAVTPRELSPFSFFPLAGFTSVSPGDDVSFKPIDNFIIIVSNV